ncbi:cytochrome P450 6A1 [Cephus cinctus]|uniref:Cytochrome P450 6A1 n=1 Tax=Cephus cinctus TaxID=211228 RepID=A0AAJ7C0I2_CEPCN|nr:cytochrome P450 6A1 [Cephus cinctus]XP_015598816.1 cytochrome P450 6A1 [Cephus cinctus]XP_015598817.1 cytochrome P450 6A1 [Cephus cinctus]XP_024942477.1 cytochrome P450 6A1 [Cephus cinctus]XP_024942478.1 cytochrome P450 6A1 [Cephus cinctus]XP_024942479.1 cytochrome P450 6A1 [Cephus cinctus]
MAALEIVCGVAVTFLLIYYYLTKNYGFWKQRGVVGPVPSVPFGNIKDTILGKFAFGILLKQFYDKYKGEQMVGIFVRSTPALVLRDPELIKDVLIKDFTVFANRGLKHNAKVDPLSANLVFLDEKEWRPLRKKLTPVFNSGKLKQMFYLLLECGDMFDKYLDHLSEKNEPIDCRDITAKFATEVISAVAFGLKTNSIADGNNEFRKMGIKVFEPSLKKTTNDLMREAMPWLYSILGKYLVNGECIDFFTKCIKDTMEYRKQNKIVRHDFVDLLVDIKEHADDITDIEITDALLTAQAFVFFTGGFEASSITMGNALYEMALHQEMQDKLRQEIKEEIKKNNGELTYEGVMNMQYLDMVFKETMRKYPPGALVARESSQPYTFRETKITIPKKFKIFIPILGLHRDPEIYPSPETFDPERFTKKAIAARHPMSYLPFGDGPRKCIGARFALYQSKIGLIKFLLRHKVNKCDKTKVPYEFHPRTTVLSPKDGIYVKISTVSV